MKKCYIFFLLLILTASSCRKDYLRDTPKWLKQHIQDCKKNGCCVWIYDISEYEDSLGSTFYAIYRVSTNTSSHTDIYDSEGNLICDYGNNGFDGISDSICWAQAESFLFRRKIWEENCP